MSSPIRYDRLKTLADVRAQRQHVYRELVRTKARLGEDYDRLGDIFSVEYWTGMLSRRLGAMVPSATWVTMGYELISMWMSRRKKKRKGKH